MHRTGMPDRVQFLVCDIWFEKRPLNRCSSSINWNNLTCRNQRPALAAAVLGTVDVLLLCLHSSNRCGWMRYVFGLCVRTYVHAWSGCGILRPACSRLLLEPMLREPVSSAGNQRRSTSAAFLLVAVYMHTGFCLLDSRFESEHRVSLYVWWWCFLCTEAHFPDTVQSEWSSQAPRRRASTDQGCSGAWTRGGGVPHFLRQGDASPHFFGLKFEQKLVHCCNWLLTEMQCQIISVQQN